MNSSLEVCRSTTPRSACLRVEQLEDRVVPVTFFFNRYTAVGASDGSVQLLNGNGVPFVSNFRPLDTNLGTYDGLVSVALGDLNGDTIPDLFVAAANPVGVAGLDASKAGRVFVYDGGTLVAGSKPTAFIHEFKPFPTTSGPDGTTGDYVNGLNIAAADVNGDLKVDLIAGTRGSSGGAGKREVGRMTVISPGTAVDGSGDTVIGSVLTPFGPGYEKGVVVASGDMNNDGRYEIAVTRGGPVASSIPAVQAVKLKAYTFRNSQLEELFLSGTANAPFAPFATVDGPASAINRDARVAFVDRNGDGFEELVFSALDPLTDPSNTQVRIGAYSVNVASGAATLVSTGPGGLPSTYLTGNQVKDHGITLVGILVTTRSNLALITQNTDSQNSGVTYLDPFTGDVQAGGFSLTVLNGGVTIDGY